MGNTLSPQNRLAPHRSRMMGAQSKRRNAFHPTHKMRNMRRHPGHQTAHRLQRHPNSSDPRGLAASAIFMTGFGGPAPPKTPAQLRRWSHATPVMPAPACSCSRKTTKPTRPVVIFRPPRSWATRRRCPGPPHVTRVIAALSRIRRGWVEGLRLPPCPSRRRQQR